MNIDPEQVAAMKQLSFTIYRQQLITFFRNLAPAFTDRFDDETLHHRLSSAVPQARSFGLTSAHGIVHYVALALLAGSKFEKDPKVAHYMSIPGVPPEVKIKRLMTEVQRKLAHIAMNRLHESKINNG